jgi:hypothetical protein
MLQDHLGTKYDITSIFKPNVPLVNVVEDLGKLSNDFKKRYHITVVGGTGNGLGRIHHYSNEKDIKFIAKGSYNVNVGFVNFFWWHDNP